MGNRLRGGGTQGRPPAAWHPGRLPPPGGEGAGLWHGSGARSGLPMLPRPPLREGPPAVVPLASGRNRAVRRESTQEIPGYLSPRVCNRGLARTLGRAEERRVVLDCARGAHL